MTFKYTKEDGTQGTGTASYNDTTGRYTVDLSGADVKAGTKVSIFVTELQGGMPIEGEYVVANTLVIQSTSNGTVKHASGGPGSDVYAFKVVPAVGYKQIGRAHV